MPSKPTTKKINEIYQPEVPNRERQSNKGKPDLQLMLLQTRRKSTKRIDNRKMLKLLNFLAPFITKLIHIMLTNLLKPSQLRQLHGQRYQHQLIVINHGYHNRHLLLSAQKN